MTHSLVLHVRHPWKSTQLPTSIISEPVNPLARPLKMLFQKLAGTCLLALSSLAVATDLPKRDDLWGADRVGALIERQATASTSSATSTSSLVADSACTNSATSRDCWSDGYSIATDFDQKHPTTGVTRTYSLELTNTTCNPDGYGEVQCFLINGEYPGPLITADWGDMLEITVTNSLQDNGTSIHCNSCPKVFHWVPKLIVTYRAWYQTAQLLWL